MTIPIFAIEDRLKVDACNWQRLLGSGGQECEDSKERQLDFVAVWQLEKDSDYRFLKKRSMFTLGLFLSTTR